MKIIERVGDLTSGRIESVLDRIGNILLGKDGKGGLVAELKQMKGQLNMNTMKAQEAEKNILEAATTVKQVADTVIPAVNNIMTKYLDLNDKYQAALKANNQEPDMEVSLDEEIGELRNNLAPLKEWADKLAADHKDLTQDPNLWQGSLETPSAEPPVKAAPDYLAGDSGATNPPAPDTIPGEVFNQVQQPGTAAPLEQQPSASEIAAQEEEEANLAAIDEQLIEEGTAEDPEDDDLEEDEEPDFEEEDEDQIDGDLGTGNVQETAPVYDQNTVPQETVPVQDTQVAQLDPNANNPQPGEVTDPNAYQQALDSGQIGEVGPDTTPTPDQAAPGEFPFQGSVADAEVPRTSEVTTEFPANNPTDGQQTESPADSNKF